MSDDIFNYAYLFHSSAAFISTPVPTPDFTLH